MLLLAELSAVSVELYLRVAESYLSGVTEATGEPEPQQKKDQTPATLIVALTKYLALVTYINFKCPFNFSFPSCRLIFFVC